MAKKPTAECFDTRLVTVDYGKCAYSGKRRINRKTVTFGWRFLKGNATWGSHFTATGEIWNATETESLCGGQCLDEIKKHGGGRGFTKVYVLWRCFHLVHRKDMTPEQVEYINSVIDEAVAAGGKLKEVKGGE